MLLRHVKRGYLIKLINMKQKLSLIATLFAKFKCLTSGRKPTTGNNRVTGHLPLSVFETSLF